MALHDHFSGGIRSSPLRVPSTRRPPASPASGQGFVLFVLLAALSGASAVAMMHKLEIWPADRVETAAIPEVARERTQAVARARSVLMRLDDANRSGNYAVFRELAAPGFQQINSTDDLERIFGWLRKESVVLQSVPGLLERSLRFETVEPQGLMRYTGLAATNGAPVNFDLIFQNARGDWRLFGIAVFRE